MWKIKKKKSCRVIFNANELYTKCRNSVENQVFEQQTPHPVIVNPFILLRVSVRKRFLIRGTKGTF